MTDFLLELRSEEIPARMQDKAREDLARLFEKEMHARGEFVQVDPVTYATPRRLTLISRNLPQRTEGTQVELKGPRTTAPEQAVEGFLRKNGLTRDQLTDRDGVWFAEVSQPGQPMLDILATVIPAIVRAFPWPKSMRWGDASVSTESQRWVRPLQGIVALFGDEVVECEVAGVTAGAATVGHRFHHPGVITIGSAADYVEKLRACHVVVDQAERRNIIALGAKMAANKAGLTLIEDEGLLIENAGLTEWPVPLLGRFDAAFLDVPPEVIQLTARVNQKYFVCSDADGRLANAFVCTANIDAADGGEKIVEGNQKVLAARLSDARFFYETDLKVKLDDQVEKLKKIVFHEKLGTVHDKVERVAKLARWLVEEGIVVSSPAKAGAQSDVAQPNPGPLLSQGNMADMAERAARLAKADLVTGMVGEFPELQGLMGGYYATAQGEDAAVAEAVRDHYKPVGQGDDVPTAPVTVAVSLADKLDTLVGFFSVDETPTGSRDPFALRRAALGIIQLLTTQSARLSLEAVYMRAMEPYLAALVRNTAAVTSASDIEAMQRAGINPQTLMNPAYLQQLGNDPRIQDAMAHVVTGAKKLLDFFADRLKVQQREAGVRHDLIDAVFALGGEDDLIRLLSRVHALQAFMATDDGANLLAGYKRAANILKKESFGSPANAGAQDGGARHGPGPLLSQGNQPLSYKPETEEAALIAALDVAAPKAQAAVEAEDFEGAMAALASLRAPIDAFFDKVTVNDPAQEKREARLALLARMRDAVHRVADFGRIEG